MQVVLIWNVLRGLLDATSETWTARVDSWFADEEVESKLNVSSEFGLKSRSRLALMRDPIRGP